MCLFVTGIAALIHLYSIGYMHGDPRFSKFFVYLNLFVFSMLMLVLGDNLLAHLPRVGGRGHLLVPPHLVLAREGRERQAGKKAFVTNRIGDWGFMVGDVPVLRRARARSSTPTSSAGAGGLATVTATGIAVLLFIGAVGKSAQLPLFVWLPDAMAGPTPVSALIHAATMVTAGVYLMTRVNPVIAAASPWVRTMIAIIGAVTALFAATIAVAQNDIKKVLAYSTVSQLGYMFLAIGSGVYVGRHLPHGHPRLLQGAAVPRLRLGHPRHGRRAGHAAHGRAAQAHADHRRHVHRRLAGHRRRAARSPASGRRTRSCCSAWNKGGIGYVLWAIGLVTALLTAFYMSRQVFMTFFGEPRWDGADPRRRGPSWPPSEVAEARRRAMPPPSTATARRSTRTSRRGR